MYHPTRGGVRGGADQFNWEDVKTDKYRENYLGHSLKAPVGRWQKGKDLTWYSKDRGGQSSKNAELAAIKQAEEEAMLVALGHKTATRIVEPLSKDEFSEALRRGQSERGDADIERVEGLGISSGRASMQGSVARSQLKGMPFQLPSIRPSESGAETLDSPVAEIPTAKSQSKSESGQKKKAKKDKLEKRKKEKKEKEAKSDTSDEHRTSHKSHRQHHSVRSHSHNTSVKNNIKNSPSLNQEYGTRENYRSHGTSRKHSSSKDEYTQRHNRSADYTKSSGWSSKPLKHRNVHLSNSSVMHQSHGMATSTTKSRHDTSSSDDEDT